MNLDSFTRHIGAVTVAALALGFSGAAIYLFVTQRPVSALLAGLVGTTIGYLLPSPVQGRVTVDNGPTDPVLTADVPATSKRR